MTLLRGPCLQDSLGKTCSDGTHAPSGISGCMGAMGDTQQGLSRAVFTMRDNQSGHHVPVVAEPLTSQVAVANSGLQTHANDLLRPQILGKVNVGSFFPFSFKNIGQCCSSQLLGWTAKATTANWKMIEK